MIRKFCAAIHPSWCFYAMLIGVIAGTAFCAICPLALCAHPLWLIAALSLLLFSLFCANRATTLLAFVAGLILANFRSAPDSASLAIITAIGEFFTQFSATISGAFQDFFAERVRTHISSPAVDLGLGYLLGQKSGLSSTFTAALSAVGMNHVVVASGTHLGIIAGLATAVFGKISRFASTFFATLIILAFVLVVGFTPSMTRAALVALLGLFVGSVGRKFAPWRLLTFTAAVTLLINPANLLSLGWQLSFASFSGILLVGPRLTRFLYGGKKPPWLATMLITSFSTLLVCAPILLYNFGTLSLLSFVANLIILPTLPYAMFLVLLTGVTSFCSPLAGFLGWLATLLLDFHIWLINVLSEQTVFILELPKGNPWFFLIYLPIIALLCYTIIYENFLRNRHARFWARFRPKVAASRRHRTHR